MVIREAFEAYKRGGEELEGKIKKILEEVSFSEHKETISKLISLSREFGELEDALISTLKDIQRRKLLEVMQIEL